MCGISLYIMKEASNNAVHEVISSLYELQNRGYDSFGIAYYDPSSNSYQTHKKSLHCFTETHPKVFEVFKKETRTLQSPICMGHSRWATHGKVNKGNAHPHVSNNKKWFVIHNGIIENYKELKSFLKTKGYTFYSETDSEVVVNIVEYYQMEHKLSIKEAILYVIHHAILQGTYGLIFLHEDEPTTAHVIKQGSPLLISETEEAFIATSELCGFLNNTHQYYELMNNELVSLSLKHGIQFEKDKPTYKQIDPDFQQHYLTQHLTGYSHFTQKEILEQDRTLLLSLNNGARATKDGICLGGLHYLKSHLSRIQNIVFLGCGSSYIAGNIGAKYIKKMTPLQDINTFCFDGGDFEMNEVPSGICLFVFISQSGETMDLMKHLDTINRNHFTMGIVNVIDSTIAKEVDCGIYMNVGKEVAVASTKSFNSSVLLLKLFSLWLYQEKTNQKDNCTCYEMLQMTNRVKEQVDMVNQMIYQVKKINHEINMLFEERNLDHFLFEHIFILGKGTMECLARECALKMKEICYIHGEGLSASSLKHGPLAMIHSYFPVILLINHEQIDKMMNVYHELRSRNAYILVVTSEKEVIEQVQTKENECDVIYIPKNRDCSEILFMLTLQHLCYALAIRKKINPDKPKNLAKVVTVE